MKIFLTKSISFKKNLLKLIILFFLSQFSNNLFAQLSGTKTICTTGCDYSSVTSAVASLNSNGVGYGGVTFKISPGHIDTLTSAIVLTATGTPSNPISFIKNGSGANPKIVAYKGSTDKDGIFIFQGCDYVTINGISLEENSKNSTPTNQMEWGFAFSKFYTGVLIDGCSNNVIKNCSITLNKTNTTQSTSSTLFKGSIGIYMSDNVFGTINTSLFDSTYASNRNEFLSNTISNVNMAFYLNGFTSTPGSYDQGNVIGRIGQGNIMTDFGGTSLSCYPIYSNAQNYLLIEGNTIKGGDGTTGNLFGIFTEGGTNSTLRIKNNTITLTPVLGNPSTIINSNQAGIWNVMGVGGTDNILEITGNVIKECKYPNSNSFIYGVYNAANAFEIKIEHNLFFNNTYGSASLTSLNSVNHIYQYYTAENKIAGSVLSISYNKVKNNTRILASSAGGGGFAYGIRVMGAAETVNIISDTVEGETYYRYNEDYEIYVSSLGISNYIISDNILRGNARTSNISVSGLHYGIFVTGTGMGIIKCFNNTVSDFTTSNGFSGSIYGIYFSSGVGSGGEWNSNYIYSNKISDYSASSGYVYGITNAKDRGYIYNNIIGNLTALTSNNAMAIRGIDVSAGTHAFVHHNTVYIPNKGGGGSSFGSAAFYTGTALRQIQFNNNIFINNAIPGINGRSVAHWRNGLSVSNIESFSQGNIFYAGTPSSRNLIYYDGILGCQTMNTYRYRVRIADMGSSSENVVFASTVGSSSKFLHIHDTIPSGAESNGYKTDYSQLDFDNEVRYGFNGYNGSGLGQDIGADEGDYKQPGTDVFPPSIYNVSAPLSCSSSSRTIAATLYDHGGIPLSGSNAPRLYYKKRKKGSFQSVAGTLTYGTSKVGYWSFNINYSSIGGFSSADTVYAYIIVQDSASSPNISSFPGGVTASGVSSITSNPRDTFYFTYNAVAMGGVYTVGSTGSNYTTIKAAVNDLISRGICGPVTINIKPGTYREKINVPAIKGSSRQNWITFKSSTDAVNDVIIIDSSLSSYNCYVWRFDNARNMTLRRVTLNSTGNNGWSVNILGQNSRSIHVIGCKMMGLNSYDFKGVVANNSLNTYYAGDKMDSLKIDSNLFQHGGASFAGFAKYYPQENIIFTNNILESGTAYFKYVSGLVIKNNVVGYLNIHLSGQFFNSAPLEVSNNIILNITTIEDSDHKPDFYGLFSNNICHGPVKNIASNYWKFYHNTVNCFNNYATPFTNEKSQRIEVKNNILSMTFPFGHPSFLAFTSDTKIPAGNIDNNIYWNPGGINFIRNLDYYDTDNFNTPGGGGGVGSKNFYPPFKGITDLRTIYNIEALAPFINTVPKDYADTTRNNDLTTIGAYEAFPDSNEAIAQTLITPVFPSGAGQQKVTIKIRNGGSNPISSIKVSYRINNDSIHTETFFFSGLNLGESKTLTLNKSFDQSHSCNRLRVWIASPNGKQDINTYNDTLAPVDINIPLSGAYTIGGTSPDFAKIEDAVNTLICAGVVGPVTFHIRPGIYREKISIPNIRGASNTNWITFQSSTKNATDVVIIDSILDGNSLLHVWRFDNAKYMTLRQVTIKIKSQTSGWGIHIYGNKTKKIKIKSCRILMMDSIGYDGAYIGLVVNSHLKWYTEGGKIDSLEIDSNFFSHGIFHMAISGLSSVRPSDEIYVRNNVMYASGGFYYYLTGFRFQNNYIDAKLIASRSTKSFAFFSTSFMKNGIFMNEVGQAKYSAASEISGNRILHCFSVNISGKNSSGRRGLFANNMISSEGYGVNFSGSDNWDIIHNTISNYSQGAVYAFYSDDSDPFTFYNHVIRNNIFSVTNPLADKSSYAFYCKSIKDTSNISHNVFWNPKGTNLLYLSGKSYTASTYRKSPGGYKSFNISPAFYNDIYDLRIKEDCFGKGTPVGSIKDDIFKTKRSTSSPSIGAYEVIPSEYSASAIRIINPQTTISIGSSYNLEVEIRNTGSKTITGLILSYLLNGKLVSDTFASLNIGPCALDTLVFTGTKSPTFRAGYNQAQCFTGRVNGNDDNFTLDDTTDVLGFCAKLSGNFTVHPSDTGTTNFRSFRQAVNALYSCGVSGPVSIKISPGAYSEKIVFDGLIPGASKKNTITFDGGNPYTSKIVNDNNMLFMNNSVVQFKGVKHIKFLNIGIENLHYQDVWGIHLKPNSSQGCDSILIKGCVISLIHNRSNGSNGSGIVISASDQYYTTGNNANYLTIDSNSIHGGQFGIVCIGGGTGNLKTKKNIFSRNILNNQISYGFYLQYQDSTEITQNKIINLERESFEGNHYGIYAQYLDYFKINKNSFELSDGIGIFMENTLGSNKRPSQLSNNMISVGASNSGDPYGMFLRYNTYLDIIDNSVNIVGNGGFSLYGYTSGTTYNNNRIVNNSFVHQGNSHTIFLEGSNTDWQASLRLMNNNNYYSKGVIFRIGNNTTSSLTTWASSTYIGSANDTKSLSLDPEYSGFSNLHTVSSGLDSMGLFVTGYTDDFDGEARNTSKPDIGADEYDEPSINIGPLALIKPTGRLDTGKTDVFIKFKNYGLTTITSAIVSYKIGKKGTPKSVTWTGSLPYLATDTVKFNGSNQYLVQMNVLDTLYYYTESPNGLKDGYTVNDTLWNCLCGMLKGTFMIGGQPSQTNFKTWNDASLRLTQCDISESVIVNVAPGIYHEKVAFNNLSGATGKKTITFQSADGNPKTTILQYVNPYYSDVDNYILKLNGARNYVFKNLTFQAAGQYQYDPGLVVLLSTDGKNYSDSNVFYHNTIRGLEDVRDYSEGYSCIYSLSTYNKANQFIGNTFINGSYGMYYNGPAGYTAKFDFNKGVVIDSNIFRNQYYIGIFAQGLDNPDISFNDIHLNGSNDSKLGMKVYNIVMGGRISNNHIQILNEGFTCLLVQQGYNPGYEPYSKSVRLNISNNSLSLLGTYLKTRNALHVDNSMARTDIYHNSINVSGYSNGAYFGSYGNDTGCSIMNNNFVTETGIPAILTGTLSAYKRVDFNNYFNTTSGGPVSQILNTKYYSLKALEGIIYKSPLNNDQKSITINPKYFRSTNLNIQNSKMAGTGSPVGVLMDIDNHPRDLEMPTIGAYEIPGDLKVTSILDEEVKCFDERPVTFKFKVRNVGYTNVSRFYLNYKIGTSAVKTDTINYNLKSGDSIIITHSKKHLFSKSGTHTLKAFTSYISDNLTNDTFVKKIITLDLPKPSFIYSDTCGVSRIKFKSTTSIDSGTITGNIWYFENNNGGQGDTISYPFILKDTFYSVKLKSISMAGCIDSISRSVHMLSPLKKGTTSNNQTICYNSVPAILSVTAATGNLSPYTYQWQSSNDSLNFKDISGADSLSYQPDTLLSTTFYRLSVTTSSGCGPVYSDTIIVDVNSDLNAGKIGTPQTICYNGIGNSIQFITNPSGAFGIYSYRWQQSSDSITWSDVVGEVDSIFTPDSLINVTYFRAVVSSGLCKSKATNGVKINLYSPINAGTIGNGQTVCGGNSPATFTETIAPSGGPGTYNLKWQYSVDSINWKTISGSNTKDYSSTKLFQNTWFRRLAENTGCPSGVSNVLKVLTLPKPNLAFNVNTHCLNDTMPLTNSSTISSGSLAYNWNFGDGTSGNANAPKKVYASVGTYDIKLIGTSNLGCKDSLLKSVTVATVPIALFSYKYKCEGDSVLFTDETFYSCVSTSGLSIYWNFGDGSTSSVQNARHHYVSPGSYNVKFKISLPGGYSDSITRVVDFNMRSKPDFSTSNQCFPTPITLTNNSSNFSTLNWAFGDGSSDTITGSSLKKTYTTPGNYSIKLISTSAVGCKDSIIKTVSIFNKADANFSVSNFCLGKTTKFINAVNGTVFYVWNFGDGDTSSKNNPDHTYSTTGNYNITLKVLSINGCKDSSSKTISIYPNPKTSFTTSNVCKGFVTKFTNTSTGAVSFKWNFGNGDSSIIGTPSYTYPKAGSYKVLLTAVTNHGCSQSYTDSHTVYELPVAAFSADNVCIGKTMIFNNSSSGNILNKWNFGDGTNSTSGQPTKIFSAPGNYKVKLHVTNNFGCKDSLTKSVTVFSKPIANFTVTNKCLGASISFNNQSTGATFYTWDFGNTFTSNSTSPNYSYPSAGTYNVKLVSESTTGCKDSISKSLIIYPKPSVSFNISNNSQCLNGNNFVLTNTSSISSGSNTYVWNFGDTKTDTSTNPKKTYSSFGNFNIQLNSISNFGCKDSIIKTVTVNPNPTAAFTINNSSQCLSINSFNLTNNSTIASGKFSSKWDLGDNTTDTSKNVSNKSYSSVKTYSVKLLINSVFNCKDSVTKTITVNPMPTAGYTIQNSAQCLSGNSFKFTNTSSISSGTLTYKWTFGNGSSTTTNPTWSYTNHGTYDVKLVVKSNNGCSDSVSKTVSVYPKITASFTVADGDQCFKNNSFSFTNGSTIPSGSFTSKWDFGDNTFDTSKNVVSKQYSLNIERFYAVKLVLTSGFGCKDSIIKNAAYVRVNPVAGFYISNKAQCLRGHNFIFTNTTSDASKYLWDFGDSQSSSASSPVKIYAKSGTYKITLYVTNTGNGCKDTTNQIVTVHPQSKANFIINDNAQCLRNNLFNFDNITTIDNPDTIFQYIWNFNTGKEVFLKSPAYSYQKAGKYKVKLISVTSKGCIDSLSLPIVVHPQSSLAFKINDTAQCNSNDTFYFTNLSKVSKIEKSDTIKLYKWNFNEGNGSSSFSPNYSYQNPGFYNVELIAQTDKGCIDSLSHSLVVHPQANISFKIVDTAQCNSIDTFRFINSTTIDKIETSDTVDSYRWNFREGVISNSISPEYSYKNPGFYNVTLISESDKGCIDSVTKSLVVHPQANLIFNINDTDQCNSSDTFLFDNLSTINKIESSDKIDSYKWNFREGSGANIKSPQYSYLKPGFYNITLTSTTDKGCVDSLIHSLTVHPQAEIGFKINDTAQCVSGNLFILEDTSSILTGSIERKWNFGDGSTGVISPVSHNYLGAGKFNIKLALISDKGCVDSISKRVIVHPKPLVKFEVNDSVQCFQLNDFIFTNNSSVDSGNLSYNWSFGDGKNSSKVDTSHQYTTMSNFKVKLIATSIFGCRDSIVHKILINSNPSIPSIKQKGIYLETDADTAIQWYFSNNLIPNENYKLLPAKETGVYKLVVYNKFGCPQESDTFSYTYNGSEDLGVLIFPNPNSGRFSITSLTPLDKIEIIDLNGKVVLFKTYKTGTMLESFSIDVSNADYLIRVSAGTKVETIKVKVLK